MLAPNMNLRITFICFLFLSINNHDLFGQIKSTLFSADTKEAIPFANIWIQGKHIGTSSNIEGYFELKIDTLETLSFSALGFKSLNLKSDQIQDSIFLEPVAIELDEVIIYTSNEAKKYKSIGNFKKKDIKLFNSSGGAPIILARYFSPETIQDGFKHLEQIKILTSSEVNSASINIRIYGNGDNGQPGEALIQENILSSIKKGKRISTIDLNEFHLLLPQNGFFIAIEILIIEENKYEFEYFEESSKKKGKAIAYAPALGMISADESSNTWLYAKGDWFKLDPKSSSNKSYQNKNAELAIELIISY